MAGVSETSLWFSRMLFCGFASHYSSPFPSILHAFSPHHWICLLIVSAFSWLDGHDFSWTQPSLLTSSAYPFNFSFCQLFAPFCPSQFKSPREEPDGPGSVSKCQPTDEIPWSTQASPPESNYYHALLRKSLMVSRVALGKSNGQSRNSDQRNWPQSFRPQQKLWSQTCHHMVLPGDIKKYYKHSYPQGERNGGSLNIVGKAGIAAARKVQIT